MPHDLHDHHATAYDWLADSARHMGATRMTRDGQPITPEDAAAIRDRVNAYVDAQGRALSNREVGRAIGVSTSVISDVRNDKYDGDTEGVLRKLDLWLEDRLKADAQAAPADFVRTGVAEDIFAVAQAAVTLGRIGLVYGGPGIGKTMTLDVLKAEKPGSVYIRCDNGIRSIASLLRLIAEGLRIMPAGAKGTFGPELMRRIVKLLKGTNRLLIFDEIHALCGHGRDRLLHVLRDLHDLCGADHRRGLPMLWCGTTDLAAYLTKREVGDEPLAQIRRRIAARCDLEERTRPGGPGDMGGRLEPLHTREEIKAIFGRRQMRLSPDAVEYLFQLANIPGEGALGECNELVTMAIALYGPRGDGKTLTAQVLRETQALRFSSSTLRHLESEIEEQARRFRLVG